MKYEIVVKEAQAVFQQYNVALTLRQLFYRLVAKRIFENTINNYKRLSEIIVKARENGEVPDDAIEDRTRDILGGDYGFTNSKDFLAYYISKFKESWRYYTKSMWEPQTYEVIIGVEKDALSKLCSDIADEYRVRTCPTKGYSSYTYVKRILDKMNPDKPNILLYFGDFDPSGLDITRDLTERLQKYGAPEFELKRIALTWEQIQQYNLPPMPTKSTDPRAALFVATHGDQCVELDALEPDVLQSLIREAIKEYIDTAAWNDTVTQIDREKEQLKRKLDGVDITFKGGENE